MEEVPWPLHLGSLSWGALLVRRLLGLRESSSKDANCKKDTCTPVLCGIFFLVDAVRVKRGAEGAQVV